MSRGRTHRVLCTSFVAATGFAYLAAAAPAGTRGARYICLHIGLSVLMLLVWATSPGAAPAEHRWTVLSGIAARLLLIACPAFTSVDVSRYLWDGRSVLVGIDPYRIPPDHAPHQLYAGWVFPGVRTDLPTLYPPGAVFLFALSALFGPEGSWWVWKVTVFAASSATVVVCDRLLEQLSRRRHLPLVALSPLLVLEAGVGAHVDALATLALAGAVYAWSRRRAGITGVLLGVGGLVKFWPLLAGVPLFFSANRREGARLICAAAALFGGAYLVILGAGYRPFGSLGVFARNWEFGSPVFSAAAALLGGRIARVLAAAVTIGVVIVGGRLGAKGRWLLGVQVVLALMFAASPVVFPWYLSALVPLLSAMPTAPILVWVLAQPLTYEVIDTTDVGGPWAPAPWVALAITLAVGLAIICERRAQLRDRARGGGNVFRPAPG